MNIAFKINAAILLVFVATVLASAWAMHRFVEPQFAALERESAELNHGRVLDAIQSLQSSLRATAQDYGFWDDTYNFMSAGKKQRKAYVADNLAPADRTFEGLDVNAIVYRRLNGSAVWSEAYDLVTGKPIEDLPEELRQLRLRHPHLAGVGDYTAVTGLYDTSYGLTLVAIAPILKTDHTGKPAGELIVARRLDVEAVKKISSVDFTIAPRTRAPAEGGDTLELTTKDTGVESMSILADVIGRPIATLTVTTPRDVSRIGADAIRSAMLSFIAAAAIVIAALWLFVRVFVVARIAALNRHFTTAAGAGDLQKFSTDHGMDEIGDLSRAFNVMADEVNHLRDAMAETSYLSGMSEWAAGTLHNVRNGLNPVNVIAWRLLQLTEAPWLKNLTTAVNEHANPETPPERREKLKSYMISCAPRILTTTQESAALVRQIDEANKAVLEIMTEYERYAHRSCELQPVKLNALVAGVARTALAEYAETIAVEVSERPAECLANKTILRQVLTNLLLNAAESITAAGVNGQIRVGFTELHSTPRKMVVTISDNGEGIAGDRLGAIFERGHSSRAHRTGGLGLHWCANAIRSQGGSITVRSDGPGQGATFIITLSVPSDTAKEAA